MLESAFLFLNPIKWKIYVIHTLFDRTASPIHILENGLSPTDPHFDPILTLKIEQSNFCKFLKKVVCTTIHNYDFLVVSGKSMCT